ncbi:MalM family protein [Klebsiella sp. BIGb0407]|uniref:MalM family protein n=1 Tax=Klebsiella sp. BIGb0407 TaxID=2940603 RepID=UPI0021673D36|nr:MalM family protein [Klebsiella sp. BIGb0407]MCS3434283.1 maltose operon protein [Klebsiella sp. BIGb0407]
MKIKKQFVNLSLLLMSIIISGCQPSKISNSQEKEYAGQILQQIESAKKNLDSKQAIHKFSDIKYESLGKNGTSVKIDEKSQVYSFESGKSYISAYVLDNNNINEINLTSPLDFSIFIPSVIILDEKYNIINYIKSSNFPYTKTTFGNSLYSGSFSLPDGYEKLYIIVYTTSEDSNKNTLIDSDLLQNSMRYDRVSDVGKYLRQTLPHSPIGHINLNIIKNESDSPPPQKTPICQLNQPGYSSDLSEQEYYKNIRESLSINDYKKAIKYVRLAECNGYKKSRDVFFSIISEKEKI